MKCGIWQKRMENSSLDRDAVFDNIVEIDATMIEPQVSWEHLLKW